MTFLRTRSRKRAKRIDREPTSNKGRTEQDFLLQGSKQENLDWLTSKTGIKEIAKECKKHGDDATQDEYKDKEYDSA